MAFISSTGSIRTEIALRLNEAESDNTSTYTGWINLAMRDITNTFGFAPFLYASANQALTAGTRFYTMSAIASDFEKMNTLTYPGGDVTLQYLSPQDFDILQPSATETGVPKIYTLRGQGVNAQLEVFPVPGGGVTLNFDYQKEIPTVSVASAVPEIPEKYLEALVLYGESLGLRRRGRSAEAMQIRNEYERMKQQMIKDLNNQTTGIRQMLTTRDVTRVRGRSTDPVINMFNRIN